MERKYRWSPYRTKGQLSGRVQSAKGGRDRLPYTPILVDLTFRPQVYHVMADDAYMNLQWRKQQSRDYQQLAVKARNYHEAYDFAMKNLTVVPDTSMKR